MNKKSFTLIELLVVIAIIGILSSLVIGRFNNWREKATIAKNLQWSSSIHKVMGANLVGYWEMNEGSGTLIKDLSGYENHGTMVNFKDNEVSGWTEGMTGETGTAIQLSKDGEYVSIPHNEMLSKEIFGTATEFTMEAWAYPRSWDNWATIINKATNGYSSNTTAGMWTQAAGFSCIIGSNEDYNPSGSSTGVSYKPDLNKWHHIVCVADGIHLKMYVDSNYIGSANISNVTRPRSENNANIIIGRRNASSPPSFNGKIGYVKLYNSSLSVKEVKRSYTESKNNYLVYE